MPQFTAFALPVACALLAASAVAHAQTPRELRGRVVDAQGGAIAGAVLDLQCGADVRRLTASASGEFAVSGINADRCHITASSQWFEPETLNIDASGAAVARIVLQVRRFAQEVVVTPTRGIEQSAFDLPEAMSVTTRRDIDSRPHVLLVQVLREEPGVLVQQTTSAQVSPIIRGFTGQSNVYLLDGVRLNTSAWRSGPSQYVSWVNSGPVSSIEVVRGGGSVQYGSDALGGTIQMLTAPSLTGVSTARVTGGVDLTGASADRSVGAQADVALQARRALVRVGGSHRRVGDLRAGGGLDSHAAVTRFLGLPSTVLGTRQRATSFDQSGGYAIADLTPTNGDTLHAMFTHEQQTGASRYDRVLGGEGLFRSGFDPQRLDFGLVRYSRPGVAGFDGLSATFSVNRQGDGRYEQARPVARLDTQTSATTSVGYQAQAHRTLAGRHQLTVGTERYDDAISAERRLVEPTGVITAARPDIPTGTGYTSTGVFGQQTVELGDRVTLRGGLRYSRFTFSTTADRALGVTDERVTMQSVTFQTSGVIALTPSVNLTANVTRGFRAPNTGDFGNIGLTGGGGFEITPSRAAELGATIGSTGGADARPTGAAADGLRPEVVYQYEVGVKARAGRFSGAVNGFDMELFDFIQRRALVFAPGVTGTTISGFDVVRQDAAGLAYIAQDVRPIATRVNVDRARIAGFEAEGELRVGQAWTTGAYFSMSNGRQLPAGEFIRRMPPPMGGARVRYTRERYWLEGVVAFAAEQTRLNSGDLSDARIGALRTRTTIASFFNGTAADLGLVRDGVLVSTGETLAQVQARVLGTATSAPLFTSQAGHAVIGVRAGLRVTSQFDVTVMGENLGDVNYRSYGSGLDAPGANVQIRTRLRF